jgi:signal peptidase I
MASFLLGLLVCIGIAYSVFALLKLNRTQHPYRMSNTSMTPTLYQGDTILVDTTACENRSIGRGELIVFRHDGSVLTKRVVALGGDIIEDRGNTFFLNGIPIHEPYAHYDDSASLQKIEWISPQHVPADELYVLGDWRTRSLDSRRPKEFGKVHVADVIGRVVKVRDSAIPGQTGRTDFSGASESSSSRVP